MAEQIRVLFVGEHARDRADVERSLRRDAGLEATAVADGAAAVDALASDDVDCVAVEHADGGTDGLAVLERVRDADPAVPVVLFAADGTESVASEAISLSVDEYVARDGVDDEFAALARTCHDAARTYRAEQDVAMLNDLARNVYERVTDAFFALDRDWRLTYLNEEAEEILDVTTEDVVGENVWDVFPAAADSRFYDEYYRAMTTQEPVTFRESYPPLDDTFEVRAFPSEDGLSVHFRSVSGDVGPADPDLFELTDVLTNDLRDSITEGRSALASARESCECEQADFEDVERSFDRMDDLVSHTIELANGEPTAGSSRDSQ